jgi:hypothetical protein
MSTFPIILIPPILEKVKLELPSVPTPPNLIQPKRPDFPHRINTKLITGEGVATIIPTGFLYFKAGPIPSLMLMATVITTITLQVWLQIKSFPHRINNYHRQASIYEKNLLSNDKIKNEYDQKVKEIRSPQNIAKYRITKVREILAETTSPNTDTSANRGRAEPYFEEYLHRYFPNKIQTQHGFTIPNFEYPYTPDFIYSDLSLGLYIDIEIDEPYFLDNTGELKPLHYNDDRRNQFFLDRRWIVIRFAEEQIVRQPESCCKVIAETIASIIGDDSILYSFRSISQLKPVQRWTQTEAYAMAANKYRDKYYFID